MRRHQWIAAIFYGITAAVSAVLGSIYLFRGQFMPYHADALGLTWSQVGSELQVLLVALMQVAGAGWLALALALLLLLVWPFRSGHRWARLGIPTLIALFFMDPRCSPPSTSACTRRPRHRGTATSPPLPPP